MRKNPLVTFKPDSTLNVELWNTLAT